MSEKKRTTPKEAKWIGEKIGVDGTQFDPVKFRQGVDQEYEHRRNDPQTDGTHDAPIMTGKIAVAHMEEFPDDDERLEKMEAEADREWAERRAASAKHTNTR